MSSCVGGTSTTGHTLGRALLPTGEKAYSVRARRAQCLLCSQNPSVGTAAMGRKRPIDSCASGPKQTLRRGNCRRSALGGHAFTQGVALRMTAVADSCRSARTAHVPVQSAPDVPPVPLHTCRTPQSSQKGQPPLSDRWSSASISVLDRLTARRWDSLQAVQRQELPHRSLVTGRRRNHGVLHVVEEHADRFLPDLVRSLVTSVTPGSEHSRRPGPLNRRSRRRCSPGSLPRSVQVKRRTAEDRGTESRFVNDALNHVSDAAHR